MAEKQQPKSTPAPKTPPGQTPSQDATKRTDQNREHSSGANGAGGVGGTGGSVL
jgi:hypothetical protein